MIRFYGAPFFHRTMFQNELAFGSFLLFAWYRNGRRDFPLLSNAKPVDEIIVETIKKTSDKLIAAIQWQRNDVLMLDNTRFMHGRNAITNTAERRIFSYFGYLNFAIPNTEEMLNAPWRSGKEMFIERMPERQSR